MYASLLPAVLQLARTAGDAILRVYNTADFGVDMKADDSPLTQADLNAHKILEPGLLQLLDGVPVLSEEGSLPDWNTRQQWQRYWIIDPLDGTKEFIKRNGEFTVNIALIENGEPVLGVVHVPVLDISYTGIKGGGAVKYEQGTQTAIHTRTLPTAQQHPIAVVASRSHGADAVDALIEKIRTQLGEVTLKNMGSSLKLCLVAEGAADIYPRLALTSEWDTAAAQAVVEAAGGQVLTESLAVMRYNTKDNILNPFFYVIGDTQYDWKSLLNSTIA
ncbi:MAG: 3'(2'),5'-bisphosphate nucleotidase CysQ [Pseudomonadales bacterium]|nr:3'(2'),5'-bisphosphate nucleotidase CysQ [Pseudomonadales bacterium]